MRSRCRSRASSRARPTCTGRSPLRAARRMISCRTCPPHPNLSSFATHGHVARLAARSARAQRHGLGHARQRIDGVRSADGRRRLSACSICRSTRKAASAGRLHDLAEAQRITRFARWCAHETLTPQHAAAGRGRPLRRMDSGMAEEKKLTVSATAARARIGRGGTRHARNRPGAGGARPPRAGDVGRRAAGRTAGSNGRRTFRLADRQKIASRRCCWSASCGSSCWNTRSTSSMHVRACPHGSLISRGAA